MVIFNTNFSKWEKICHVTLKIIGPFLHSKRQLVPFPWQTIGPFHPNFNHTCWHLARDIPSMLAPSQGSPILVGTQPGISNPCWHLARNKASILTPRCVSVSWSISIDLSVQTVVLRFQVWVGHHTIWIRCAKTISRSQLPLFRLDIKASFSVHCMTFLNFSE